MHATTCQHPQRILQPTAVVRRQLPWGAMVTVEVGASFSIPLHPEHQEAILRVAASGEVEYIRDETGREWHVDPIPGVAGVVLGSGQDSVAVALSSVLG